MVSSVRFQGTCKPHTSFPCSGSMWSTSYGSPIKIVANRARRYQLFISGFKCNLPHFNILFNFAIRFLAHLALSLSLLFLDHVDEYKRSQILQYIFSPSGQYLSLLNSFVDLVCLHRLHCFTNKVIYIFLGS